MRDSAQIDTPLSSPRTRAVAIFLSAVLQTYAQLLCMPFIPLRHLWHVSLNPDLVAFCEYWKGRWKEHQSSNLHIQVLTDHFWGCVGGFYEIMPPFYLPKFTIVRVLLTFLEVCKFTFCDRKGYCVCYISLWCLLCWSICSSLQVGFGALRKSSDLGCPSGSKQLAYIRAQFNYLIWLVKNSQCC